MLSNFKLRRYISALDQYSRHSIPQYGGFRPQVGRRKSKRVERRGESAWIQQFKP